MQIHLLDISSCDGKTIQESVIPELEKIDFLWGAIVVIELEIPLTLIPKEALSAQWPCTWLSLTLTFCGMGENSPANQMAPLYSAVQMWM